MIKVKLFALLALVSIFGQSGCSRSAEEDNPDTDSSHVISKKYKGYVGDAKTAKKVAEAIWVSVYGPSVLNEKPFKTSVIGDSVWIVEGTLGQGKIGGTAYIEIRMKDCKILQVTHGK